MRQPPFERRSYVDDGQRTCLQLAGRNGQSRSARRCVSIEWSQNVLVFVPCWPPINGRLMPEAGLSLYEPLASSVYIINDCLDLSPIVGTRGKKSPFASGDLSIPFSLTLAAVCLVRGVLLALRYPIVPARAGRYRQCDVLATRST